MSRAEHRQNLEEFKQRYDILRKKPISTIYDLRNYDFLILHPDMKDMGDIMNEILSTYPNKPIILPDKSIASGKHPETEPVLDIENVKKDPKYESVYIVNTNSNVLESVISLMNSIIIQNTKYMNPSQE